VRLWWWLSKPNTTLWWVRLKQTPTKTDEVEVVMMVVDEDGGGVDGDDVDVVVVWWQQQWCWLRSVEAAAVKGWQRRTWRRDGSQKDFGRSGLANTHKPTNVGGFGDLQAFRILRDVYGGRPMRRRGIGIVLLAKGSSLCYFSRKLRPRMHVAATYQKELFAIVEAVYKWRHYLLGRHFTIRTDHRSLKELLHQGEVTVAFMTLNQPLVGLLDKLRQENKSLEELQVLHRRIDSNEVMEGFRREQGLLLFCDRYYAGAESKLKELLLSEFHDTPMAGHSGVKKMLVVAVDRFTKYAYFGALPTSFNMSKVVEVFLDMVVKLHGIPKIIVSDCDPIFVSQFWKQLFEVRFLAWAEYSYNTTFHSSIKMTPFQAVYGRVPPLIVPDLPGSSKVAAVEELLVVTLAKRHSNKLAKCYYGPFEILELGGKVVSTFSSRIQSKIHPGSHGSLLKPFLGSDTGRCYSKLTLRRARGASCGATGYLCDLWVLQKWHTSCAMFWFMWNDSSPEEVQWESG
ncbi:ty3-gypsy retrotransposon protein, partial [Tanacetum coccineum]